METEHQHTAQSASSESFASLRSKYQSSTQPIYATQEEADAAWRAHVAAKGAADLWAQACVPARHAGVTELHGQAWNEAFTRQERKLGSGFLVAFVGARGPGKTQMGVELIRCACRRGLASRYTTAIEFFMALKGCYGDNGKKRETDVIAEFCRPVLLVLDETQERGNSEWEDRMLTHLIDRRYRDERDTVLISNLSIPEFEASIGASVVSRLIETGGIVNFNWPSFRK